MASGIVEKTEKSGLLFQGFYFKMCVHSVDRKGEIARELLTVSPHCLFFQIVWRLQGNFFAFKIFLFEKIHIL